MAPPKRKYKFHADYEREFQGIKAKKAKNMRVVCRAIWTLIWNRWDRQLFWLTKKGTNTNRICEQCQPLKQSTPLCRVRLHHLKKIVALLRQAVWAYHLCRHAQSFKSSDCVSSDGLFRTMFSDSAVAKKFGCAQTKTSKIITGVRAPFSVKQNFLQTTLDYIDKWFRLERFPKSINCVGLEEKEVQHADVLELASEIAPELEDKLFDEITDLNRILAELPNFVGISIEEKWKQVFRLNSQICICSSAKCSPFPSPMHLWNESFRFTIPNGLIKGICWK